MAGIMDAGPMARRARTGQSCGASPTRGPGSGRRQAVLDALPQVETPVPLVEYTATETVEPSAGWRP